jgi:hypothetical protein
MTITYDRVRELFDYNEKTGDLVWKVSTSRKIKPGQVAGSHDKTRGYVMIGIDGRKQRYSAHRVIWLWYYGRWPESEIDHINGIRNDNRISNLREATTSENRQNRCVQSNNNSGYNGVHFHKVANKWQAGLKVNGQTLYLGLFDNKEDAYDAHLKAKQHHHTFQPTRREGLLLWKL